MNHTSQPATKTKANRLKQRELRRPSGVAPDSESNRWKIQPIQVLPGEGETVKRIWTLPAATAIGAAILYESNDGKSSRLTYLSTQGKSTLSETPICLDQADGKIQAVALRKARGSAVTITVITEKTILIFLAEVGGAPIHRERRRQGYTAIAAAYSGDGNMLAVLNKPTARRIGKLVIYDCSKRNSKADNSNQAAFFQDCIMQEPILSSDLFCSGGNLAFNYQGTELFGNAGSFRFQLSIDNGSPKTNVPRQLNDHHIGRDSDFPWTSSISTFTPPKHAAGPVDKSSDLYTYGADNTGSSDQSVRFEGKGTWAVFAGFNEHIAIVNSDEIIPRRFRVGLCLATGAMLLEEQLVVTWTKDGITFWRPNGELNPDGSIPMAIIDFHDASHDGEIKAVQQFGFDMIPYVAQNPKKQFTL
jgi:hypothetical protein